MKKYNGRYIDGRTLKKYFCIDCGKEITYQSGYYGQGRCPSCSNKLKNKDKPSNNSKGGITLKEYYCIDCGEKINFNTTLYGKERCNICSHLGGKNNPMFGKKGKDAPNYIHGQGNAPYPLEFNDKLKLKIRKRDEYTCQLCDITEEEHIMVFGQVLTVHHIDYNKENCKEDNLITLCNKCNAKVNNNRDYWYAYFTYIMEN